MSGKNHHSEPFDDSTLVKLDLYRRYVRAWLPVFLNSPKLKVDRIQVFDFFAGPGMDKNGKSGSPLIAMQEIHNALSQDHRNNPEIHLYLNEMMKHKFETLQATCAESQFAKGVKFHFLNKEFQDAFSVWRAEIGKTDIGCKTASLLFLDQNGTKQITREVFSQIVSAARTDFLFFIASSYIYRFKTQPHNVEPAPILPEDFNGMTMKNVHRKVCEAYRRLIPYNWRYYLAPFSIAKDSGSNVYGLIFGSGHPLGMDKFLKICWDEDPLTGEANYDIDDDNIQPEQMTLWEERPKKIECFERELKQEIDDQHLCSNVDVYNFALNRGFRATHAKNALNKMVKSGHLPKQTFAISYESCGSKDSIPRPIVVNERKQK